MGLRNLYRGPSLRNRNCSKDALYEASAAQGVHVGDCATPTAFRCYCTPNSPVGDPVSALRPVKRGIYTGRTGLAINIAYH